MPFGARLRAIKKPALPSVQIVLGPTAVGKTEYAIHLAKQKNGEVISADSMQVYRGMNIGTNKPSMGEREGIPHYLIDIRDPNESWTVADFVRETEKLIREITDRGKLPIIAGGTGFYLWAFLEGLPFPALTVNAAIREKLLDEAENKGGEHLYEKLRKSDPAAAQKIHPNNTKRVIRALEVLELSGRPFSSFERGVGANEKYSLSITGLTMPREQLHKRINARVEKFMARGLTSEVRELLEKGYSAQLPSMQALGYKETIQYLHGEWDEKKLIGEIKKRTRHFAKRQYVWFRRFEDVEWLEAGY